LGRARGWRGTGTKRCLGFVDGSCSQRSALVRQPCNLTHPQAFVPVSAALQKIRKNHNL
jgi:hypothetical protein